MVVTQGSIKRFYGAATTSPFENAVTTTGGLVGYSAAIQMPTASKTTTNSIAVIATGMRVAPSSTTTSYTPTPPTGYSNTVQAVFTAPNNAQNIAGMSSETTVSAAGSFASPSYTTATAGTTNRQVQSWAAWVAMLKPAVSGTAPVIRNAITVNDNSGSMSVTIASSATTNDVAVAVFDTDDPSAVVSPPDGTWTQLFGFSHTNGSLYGFWRPMSTTAAYTGTFTTAVVAATAPVNTTAPVVSGTPAVGSVLSSTTGAWTQNPTGYTYQWQSDGTNISGATGSTYTVVSADAGHTIRCAVTATNSVGSTSANSNGIAIPSAPVNTVAPVVTTDGTPATGETITTDTGTWTGTGITYAYQWYRGTSPISGQTATSYLLDITDEGASISCRVTATNGGGAATANSNTITPAVSSPLSDASFLSYLSGGTGNTDPSLSIGGARGGTLPTGLNGLIGPILGSVAQAGGVFYRVIYVRNTHTTATAAACKLFLEAQFSSPGLTLAVAVPAQAANTTVPALASQTTAPSGVTWTSTTDPTAGLDFGSLAPSAYRGIYLRITVAAGTTPTTEADATVAVEGSAA